MIDVYTIHGRAVEIESDKNYNMYEWHVFLLVLIKRTSKKTKSLLSTKISIF